MSRFIRLLCSMTRFSESCARAGFVARSRWANWAWPRIAVSGVRSSWTAVLKKSAASQSADAGPPSAGKTLSASAASPPPAAGRSVRCVDNLLELGEELEHQDRLVDHARVARGLAPFGLTGPGVGECSGVHGEHQHLE